MDFRRNFNDFFLGRPCVFIAIYNENDRFPVLRKDMLTLEKGIEKRLKNHQNLNQILMISHCFSIPFSTVNMSFRNTGKRSFSI